jgi:ribosomal protein S12 methylthiotransferase accessory factor
MSADAATWFSDLVSDRTGIIRSLSEINRGAAEPSPPVFYLAILAHFDFRKAPVEDRIGVGKGLTKADAMAGAVGEALERYCGSQPDSGAVKRFAWIERPSDAIRPTDCVLYSDRQYARADFRYQRWREDQVVSWIPAVDLSNGAPVWVPTSLIFLDYAGNSADVFFCPPTSNGLGAGASLELAALSGLYELIERDSFLVTWMNRLPAYEALAPASAPIETNFIRHYARFGIETRVFRLETDLPAHVMMAILLDRSGEGPAAVVGLGCHPDPFVAFRKAIFEAAQTRPSYAQRFKDRATWEGLREYRDVRTLADHSAFFASTDRLAEFDFLFDHGNKLDLADLSNFAASDAERELARISEALSGAGCRVICADLTTPDLHGYPVRVVRVLAMGLQPIHFGYGEERLGGRRLFELPMRLGHTRSVVDETELNPCPHPLS